MTIDQIIEKYNAVSHSERDKGARFERLMQAFLLTVPQYNGLFQQVYLWNEFPYRADFGGQDVGIDLVALTIDGDYWAVQCKCVQPNTYIDKPAIDTFLSTSSKQFNVSDNQTIGFTRRLWISTSNNWSSTAEQTIQNQQPPVSRFNLSDLQQSPVDWEKLEQGIHGDNARTEKKQLRPHQQDALNKTNQYFKTSDRGKLIMACGTGKTFNSLRIAEHETNNKGLILFLVPSIALLGQTLREWSADAQVPITPICICSDPEVSKKKTKIEDTNTFSVVDLALPASTNVKEILKQFNQARNKGVHHLSNNGLTVIFSTYQSIEVISRAQAALLSQQSHLSPESDPYGIFDLIICDEAHRTTGVTLSGEDESAFTKVHDNNFLKAKKRLYMTATPRLYSDDSKSKAAQAEAILCSMDDENIYGSEIYRIGFGEAVERGLLSDYKVLILTLKDSDVPPSVQSMIADNTSEINADDASKLIGCVNALSKQIIGDATFSSSDPEPMRRAVCFCESIKKSSLVTRSLRTVSSSYINSLPEEIKSQTVSITSHHIDGTMSATTRDNLMSWLKSTPEEGQCHVLSNVRCLCEGVDVPALDAVIFLSPKNSQVDVVQSVGRVMRKAPNKKYGYIIIPVIVPSNIAPEVALQDNERYKVVWTVLNALRAHDDRFNATVNKIELNKARPAQILPVRPRTSFDPDGYPVFAFDDPEPSDFAKNISQQFQELQNVVFARMVQKVGDRRYWEQWAKSVAEIAEMQIERITNMVRTGEYKQAFENFLTGLQKNINPSITQADAIEMLSQHIITRPVFDALFEGYSFVQNNPISLSMQNMLNLLEQSAIEKDTEKLQRFYKSVKERAAGIDNAEGKQRIIIELYDTFFKTAFPKLAERLGIVYTPVPVVDFIIHSVNDILNIEFGRSLSDENVNIIDPFTGTGTFITRLLQSGIIRPQDLLRKYKHEIFANELVLLAYYIAAVNIENVFHETANAQTYQPFDGICLTDTFQLGETDIDGDMFSKEFEKNSERVQRQKQTPITVIIGNPPYSIGQRSANDNAQNQSYPKLDNRIADTYVARTAATLRNSLYDSYIKAFRWSSDRLKTGIIGFITNGAWLDSKAGEGFRKCLFEEFSSIYVFNLRGFVRGRSGDAAKREGQNVFNVMTGVAVTILVKKPNHVGNADIYYYDIGDYLNKIEKFEEINKFKSVINIDFSKIIPDEHGDWLNLRSSEFSNFIPLEPSNKFDIFSKSFFNFYAVGVKTNRDAWVYNFSKAQISYNMRSMIDFYNEQSAAFAISKTQNSNLSVEDFIDTNPSKISWTRALRNNVSSNLKHCFKEEEFFICSYRPFSKQYLYYDKPFIEVPSLWHLIFPSPKHDNMVIVISRDARIDFSFFISNSITDFSFIASNQCFPLYWYEPNDKKEKTLFDAPTAHGDYTRHDAISDFILKEAQQKYAVSNVPSVPNVPPTKIDIFYYVYGFLHSPQYRQTFAADLKKMLPRLPLVENPADFWAFSNAGRALAELHLNYETVQPHPAVIETSSVELSSSFVENSKEAFEFYQVQKMRFPAKDKKDTIIYNSHITIENIPPQAYQYIVNGKSAIEWIIERYQLTTHSESGIQNNPNHWAEQTGNPRYILDLLHSVINLSVQTVQIVNSLPNLTFKE